MSFPSFNVGDVLTASDMNAVGMWLVKTQTVGSAVSSVEVTGAFSSAYDHYRIIYYGGTSSADGDIRLKLGSTVTGYYSNFAYVGYIGSSWTFVTNSNGTSWTVAGSARTTCNQMDVVLYGPNLAEETAMQGMYVGPKTTSVIGPFAGFLNNTTQYTSFTIEHNSGTFTGGTIRVYGLRN